MKTEQKSQSHFSRIFLCFMKIEKNWYKERIYFYLVINTIVSHKFSLCKQANIILNFSEIITNTTEK